MSSQPPIIELSGVTKAYGPTVANDDVSFKVEPGRVHALLGENGAGKSTLMTAMAGQVEADTCTFTAAPGTSVG